MHRQRWNLYFSGHVQGVGFRYQTLRTANQFSVSGWVKNLVNGSVHVVVEGEVNEIEAFVAGLRATMAGFIKQVEIEKTAASGEFSTFEIRS